MVIYSAAAVYLKPSYTFLYQLFFFVWSGLQVPLCSFLCAMETESWAKAWGEVCDHIWLSACLYVH